MRLRKLLRIARWEVTKNAGGIDRRTVAVAGIALLAAALFAPYAATQGVALDGGIYRVGVAEDSPYHAVVEEDPTFAVREPSEAAFRRGNIEILVAGEEVVIADTRKGRAALSELQSSVERFNDRRMAAEANQSAAFPVAVTLRYVEREQIQDVIATGAGTGDGGGDSVGGAGGSDGGEDSVGGGGAGGPEGGEGGGDGAAPDGRSTTNGGGPAGGLGGFADSLSRRNATGTPADIAPPFPFRSLVLAFLFVLPMNFVIQAYGSTMLSERLNRRGELLLVSPVARGDIIGGKTLPYFLAAMAVVALIAAVLGGGPVSVLAVVPIALLFLAATFVGAMFARSFKELTFVTVTVTVSLTSYAFIPAIFTDVGPVALISPLTLVVRDLQGEAITALEFVFSTLPPTLTAGVLFALGAGIYREEDMFTQRPIPLKLLDALAARVHRRWHVAALSALLLPFVFVAELAAVAVLFAIPPAFSVPAILALVAVIEELAKSLHVYAGYVHGRFDRTLRTATVVGALSGVGFFVGEKITLLAQLVGLPELTVGRAAFLTGTGTPSLPVVVALLLAPLVLHVVTAAISSIGASRGRRPYAIGVTVAVAVHLAYNLTVVTYSGAL